MAKCDYCNSTILFGGVTQGTLRFCSQKCYRGGYLLSVSHRLAPETVKYHLDQTHQGLCPKCHSRGPIDVHTSHQVMSFLILTRWTSKPQVSCRSCGIKSQIQAAGISLLFGWWGFPWGLIMTPVQVTRNIIALCNPPDAAQPSAQLEKLVRLHVASHVVAQQQAAQQPQQRA